MPNVTKFHCRKLHEYTWLQIIMPLVSYFSSNQTAIAKNDGLLTDSCISCSYFSYCTYIALLQSQILHSADLTMKSLITVLHLPSYTCLIPHLMCIELKVVLYTILVCKSSLVLLLVAFVFSFLSLLYIQTQNFIEQR